MDEVEEVKQFKTLDELKTHLASTNANLVFAFDLTIEWLKTRFNEFKEYPEFYFTHRMAFSDNPASWDIEEFIAMRYSNENKQITGYELAAVAANTIEVYQKEHPEG